jgi:glycosyltransferase involved in cell wall biosynthesis
VGGGAAYGAGGARERYGRQAVCNVVERRTIPGPVSPDNFRLDQVPRRLSEPVPDERTITVVMPTYNRGALLRKAVDSVLREDRVPIALAIFDNASTDDTEAVAREIMERDSRVSYVRRPENFGSIGNFQRALATIDTTYFVPLADDDWLLPDFLKDAHDLLEAHDEAGAAVFVAEHLDEQGNLLGTYPAARDRIGFGLLSPHDHLSDWMEYGHYMWSSVLWRTDVLKAVGAPYMRTGLPSDVDFQAQIFVRHGAYLVDRPGAVFLSHPAQSSAGYDVSHVASWGLLFKRLDRAVRRTRVLSPSEYERLRRIMRDRYRATWQAPAAVQLPARTRLIAAIIARSRLGDREAAAKILGDGRLGRIVKRIGRRR